MNKHILLSLLIISPSFVHAMENNSYFSLNEIKANKNEFESQLLQRRQEKKYSYSLQLFFTDCITITPVGFLQYCYYQKFHNNELSSTFNKLKTSHSALKKRQEAEINGYSALGAAIIAPKISINERRNFIQELINRGFKPTPKDIGLAELNLYDEIAEQQETILHFLHANSIYWSMLPQEIKAQITQCMIQLLWLLPETTFNNL